MLPTQFPAKKVGSRVKFEAPDGSGVTLIGTITQMGEFGCTVKTDTPFCKYAGDPLLEEITDEFLIPLSEAWQFVEIDRDGAHASIAWISLNPLVIDPDFLTVKDSAKPAPGSPAAHLVLQNFISDLKTVLGVPDVGKAAAVQDSDEDYTWEKPAPAKAESFPVATEYGEIETLPHAEDFVATYGELAFVGLWVYWDHALRRMSDYISQNVTDIEQKDSAAIQAILTRENTLMQWVENSADYLPEWAKTLLEDLP